MTLKLRLGLAMVAGVALGLGGGVAQVQAQVPYSVVAPPSPGQSFCAGGMCQGWSLSQTRSWRRGDGRAFRILIIGDSLTQSGWIGQAMQTQLQATGRGIQVTSRGEQGADTRFLGTLGDAEISAMLEAVQPDLVILAYGVNDGFRPDIDRQGFEDVLTGQVQRMRRLAPNTDLMIAGAPDGLGRGRGNLCAGSEFGAPYALAMVRDVQRRVAARQGVAFWDWYGRMGGSCSAERLASVPPGWGVEPLMRPDRVHFTASGAAWIGRMLAEDLLSAGEAR